MNDPYKTLKAAIIRVTDETSNIKSFLLKPEKKFSFKTGQFVQFTVPGIGEAPFTPSSSHFEKDEIEITIMKAGRVTSRIHELKPKDVVGIRGPLGKGYPLEEFEGKEILILGGEWEWLLSDACCSPCWKKKTNTAEYCSYTEVKLPAILYMRDNSRTGKSGEPKYTVPWTDATQANGKKKKV